MWANSTSGLSGERQAPFSLAVNPFEARPVEVRDQRVPHSDSMSCSARAPGMAVVGQSIGRLVLSPDLLPCMESARVPFPERAPRLSSPRRNDVKLEPEYSSGMAGTAHCRDVVITPNQALQTQELQR